MKSNNSRWVALLSALLILSVLSTPQGIRFAHAANSYFIDLLQLPANQASTTQSGAMSPADKLGVEIRARFTITCTLPAYTGSGAADSRVLTANANGVLSTSCTDGVTAAPGDQVLIAYNPTDTTEAGIFTVTAIGSGGAPWVLTRTATDGLNTAARLQGNTVRVLEGFEAGHWLCRQTAITLGTTPLLWRKPVPPDARHGYYANAQFSEQGAQICSVSVNSAATGYSGFLCNSIGAATRVLNNATGDGNFETGTTATGVQQLVTATSNMSLARYEIEYGIRFLVATASDGTNTFSLNFGLFADANNFSRLSFVPSAGANITHVTTVASVAGATRTLCTGCFAAGTTYRYLMRKPFGSSVYELWFDPGTGVLGFIDNTPAIASTNQGFTTSIIKSLGAVSRTVTVSEVWVSFYDPLAFGG